MKFKLFSKISNNELFQNNIYQTNTFYNSCAACLDQLSWLQNFWFSSSTRGSLLTASRRKRNRNLPYHPRFALLIIQTNQSQMLLSMIRPEYANITDSPRNTTMILHESYIIMLLFIIQTSWLSVKCHFCGLNFNQLLTVSVLDVQLEYFL